MKEFKEWYKDEYLPKKMKINKDDLKDKFLLTEINRYEKVALLIKDSFEKPSFIEISNEIYEF